MNTLCGMIFVGNMIINSCQITYVEITSNRPWPNNDVECVVGFVGKEQIAFTVKERCDELTSALAKQDDNK